MSRLWSFFTRKSYGPWIWACRCDCGCWWKSPTQMGSCPQCDSFKYWQRHKKVVRPVYRGIWPLKWQVGWDWLGK